MTGKGGFQKATEALANEMASGGCVASADVDKDGDFDLLVGNRLVPALYPLLRRVRFCEMIQRKENIVFTDATAKFSEALSKSGMVTAVVWVDINKDTCVDLVIAGEWMPVRIFQMTRQNRLQK